jgi:NAD(P)-dependent dehydrogenase (short-subunit alcohol dehydrogenase family)
VDTSTSTRILNDLELNRDMTTSSIVMTPATLRGDHSVGETKKLDEKVAVVTGAGSVGEGFGTGKAMATLFSREGAKVVLVDNSEERANDTLAVIEGEGGTASIVLADLRDLDAPQQIVDRAVATYGTVDILVNNAAVAVPISILDTSVELLQDTIAVNLTAPFLLTKAVIPVMQTSGGGAVLYISSITALRGTGGQGRTAYAATKAAMMGMTTDLADAWGKDGIRFNTIFPGMITTPHRAKLIAESGHSESEYDLAGKTCLGREGDSWDIARAALFLCGPDGSYVTGHLMPVDGGTVARSH